MTFNEKRIMIAACVSYQKKKTSEAERLRKKGESGKASEALADAGIARSMESFFAEILPMPSGSVKI